MDQNTCRDLPPPAIQALLDICYVSFTQINTVSKCPLHILLLPINVISSRQGG